MNQSKPSYRLVPIVQTPVIDPGDTIEIYLYGIGHGEIEKASLSVNLDHPNLLKSDNPGRYIMNVGWVYDEKSGLKAPIPGFITVNSPEEPTLTVIDIIGYFYDYEYLRDLTSLMDSISPGDVIAEESPESMYSPIVFSNNFTPISSDELPTTDDREQIQNFSEQEPRPPMVMELNTLSSKPILRMKESGEYCQPGDYTIGITLTYGDDEMVYQDQKEVTIHVNDIVERNRTKLRAIAIILAGLAGLAALPTLYSNIIELVSQLQSIPFLPTGII